MIVVTGPGRGGTSLIASLYRELGFEPGGRWIAETNAGFEDEEIVRANGAITQDLRLSVMASRAAAEDIRRKNPGLGDSSVSRVRWAARHAVETLALKALGRSGEQLELVPWERFDAVVARHGPRLRALAESREVVKDPLFCWTLEAWARAGAPIEHVLVCLRNVDAMVESRMAARQVFFHSRHIARNSFIYGIGMCMAAIYDHALPHSVVRFPDFTESPDALYEAMRFPRPVSREAFLDAFGRIVRPELVHHRS